MCMETEICMRATYPKPWVSIGPQKYHLAQPRDNGMIHSVTLSRIETL
jgi:hypothetical protein